MLHVTLIAAGAKMGPTVASTEAPLCEVKSTVEGNAAAIWWVLVKARQRTADSGQRTTDR